MGQKRILGKMNSSFGYLYIYKFQIYMDINNIFRQLL